MYKVVIVDDEPIIVEGLRKGIRWEEWNCKVVGTASSGAEGLEIIQRERPNILFSDISMPGMNGLVMIASLKSQFEHMQISILTGFRDFDYAQQAIRLGVTRFLLKPSKMEELEEAVSAMTERLKELNVEESAEEDSETFDSVASSFIVKNALQYIDENYPHKIKLSDVAEKTYVSQWHLSKILNRHTGQNFSELLNGIRIEKAKGLLEDAALRIGDIAEAVGFLDMAHFARVFKKLEGVSANEYRNTIFGSNGSNGNNGNIGNNGKL